MTIGQSPGGRVQNVMPRGTARGAGGGRALGGLPAASCACWRVGVCVSACACRRAAEPVRVWCRVLLLPPCAAWASRVPLRLGEETALGGCRGASAPATDAAALAVQ